MQGAQKSSRTISSHTGKCLVSADITPSSKNLPPEASKRRAEEKVQTSSYQQKVKYSKLHGCFLQHSRPQTFNLGSSNPFIRKQFETVFYCVKTDALKEVNLYTSVCKTQAVIIASPIWENPFIAHNCELFQSKT